MRTRHKRPSRPSRVVKELMAALMRFPAAVYQFSFVNVAPFFPPSVGDLRAPARHFNSWMELIHYAEPSACPAAAATAASGHRRSEPRSILRLPRGESRGCYITRFTLCRVSCDVTRRVDHLERISGLQPRLGVFFATVCVPKSGKQPPLHIFCEER